MINVINLYWIGKLNDDVIFAGVGLGLLVTNSFGTAFIEGLNDAMQTIFSQTDGTLELVND